MTPRPLSSGFKENDTNSFLNKKASLTAINNKDDPIYKEGKKGKNNNMSYPKSIKAEIGIRKFNIDCDKGIDYMMKKGKLTSAQSVAAFLFKNSYILSKTSIGKYLSGNDPFKLSVLDSYSSMFHFENLNILEAFRKFMIMFVIPGEGQQIDRIVQSFSKHYQRQNSSQFPDPDLCYSIAFSLMILNTALHNPNVKMKPTPDQFIQSIQSADESRKISQSFLMNLFKDVKREPFYYPDQDIPIPHPVETEKEGWLIKYPHKIYKTTCRRWFVLSNCYLYYYQNSTDKNPLGIINLKDTTARIHSTISYCFEITSVKSLPIIVYKQIQDGNTMKRKSHKVYKLKAYSHQDTKVWVNQLSCFSKSQSVADTPTVENGMIMSTFL